MDLWGHSFRKAFAALVIVLALLVVFLVVLQASESLRETTNTDFSVIKIQENNAQHEFSLPEARVEVVHGSESFTLRDLNIQVSDENE